jgi:hypothetical protein
MNERIQAARSEETLEIATPADLTATRGDHRLAVVPQDIFLSTATMGLVSCGGGSACFDCWPDVGGALRESSLARGSRLRDVP